MNVPLKREHPGTGIQGSVVKGCSTHRLGLRNSGHFPTPRCAGTTIVCRYWDHTQLCALRWEFEILGVGELGGHTGAQWGLKLSHHKTTFLVDRERVLGSEAVENQ